MRILLGVLAALLLVCGRVAALEIELPQDTTTYRPSDLPGFPLALQDCLTCHSSQYVQTQPPLSSRVYWDATVHKMKNAFGAPVEEADTPALVDYLTKTYGAEAPPELSHATK
ncbi:MAG: cytochrome c [Ferrovum sp.]|nr:cytochrome c [Ferrovum sp.]